MSEPPITVITVARNHSRFFDACAASVLAQQGPDFQWIVVDNASDQDTPQRLRAWAARDRRVRPIFSTTNLLQTGGLRRALEVVRSPFVAVLDGDDVALPGRLSRSLAWLAADVRRLALFGESEIIDEEGRPLPPWLIARDAGALRRMAEFMMPAIYSTSAWRTDWLRQALPRSEVPWVHDYCLLLLALEEGEVGFWPEPLAQYRVHPGGDTRLRPQLHFAAGVAVSLWHAQHRAGRDEPLELWTDWAQRVASTASGEGEVHAAAARRAWEVRLPRHALYHARRAIRRGQVGLVGIVAAVLLQTRLGRHDLWPILRGGLLAVGRVDGQGHSLK
jgi:hypothetical protein